MRFVAGRQFRRCFVAFAVTFALGVLWAGNSIRIGKAKGRPGEIVEVPVFVSFDQELWGLMVSCAYDPEALLLLRRPLDGAPVLVVHVSGLPEEGLVVENLKVRVDAPDPVQEALLDVERDENLDGAHGR